jgi:hypothetical protein
MSGRDSLPPPPGLAGFLGGGQLGFPGRQDGLGSPCATVLLRPLQGRSSGDGYGDSEASSGSAAEASVESAFLRACLSRRFRSCFFFLASSFCRFSKLNLGLAKSTAFRRRPVFLPARPAYAWYGS